MYLWFPTGGTMKLWPLLDVMRVCLMKLYMSQAALGNATTPVRIGSAVVLEIWET